MCGIIGLISNYKHPLSEVALGLFLDALQVGVLRGKDSTGIFIVTQQGNCYTLKCAQNSTHFLENPETVEFFKKHHNNIIAIFGHNRAATKGKISDETAHPFIHKNTVLIHNGTLFGHKSLADCEVDSEAICHAISKKSYQDILPELDGAFALVWYEAHKKKLNITRNNDRSLWIFETPTFDFICSENKMGDWLLTRTIKSHKPIVGKYFKAFDVYEWDITKLEKGFYISHTFEEKKTISYQKHFTVGPHGSMTRIQEPTYIVPKYKVKNGQLLSFYISTIEYINDEQIKITGHIWQWSDITLIMYVKDSPAVLKDIEQQEMILGKVFGYDQNKDIIYLRKPDTKTIISLNNIPISIDNDTTCYKCNAPITEADNKLVWARQKQNQTKIICGNCVDKIPQLKDKYVF